MLLEPGRNSDVHVQALTPDTHLRGIQLAWQAFQLGGDEFYKTWWEFMQDIRHGHIVPVVMWWDDGKAAQFGMELMADDNGPYISFLYYVGSVDGRSMNAIVAYLYAALQSYKQGFGMGPEDEAYVRIIGRPGWARWLKRLGLYMDETGFISDQQEVLYHGFFGRKQ